jgi:hypothetical protein
LHSSNCFVNPVVHQKQRFIQMCFLHDQRPFSGAVAASSAVNRNVGTHDASRCRLPTRRDKDVEGGSATREGTSQQDEWMRRVARQRRTRYLFWQPSEPPDRGDVGEGRRAGCTARRPATSHFFSSSSCTGASCRS